MVWWYNNYYNIFKKMKGVGTCLGSVHSIIIFVKKQEINSVNIVFTRDKCD